MRMRCVQGFVQGYASGKGPGTGLNPKSRCWCSLFLVCSTMYIFRSTKVLGVCVDCNTCTTMYLMIVKKVYRTMNTIPTYRATTTMSEDDSVTSTCTNKRVTHL